VFERYDWREDELLARASKDASRKLVCSYLERPQELRWGRPVEELGVRDEVKEALRRLGIQRLFLHQERALELVLRGVNTFLVSGTGTGKTEAFLIPILNDVVERPFEGVRALLMYPTKALARDQLKRVERMVAPFFGVRAVVYDGDTPRRVRKQVHASPPPILITNPDMVHVSLQASDEFRRIVRAVRYVVLDDAHAYSGVFGAHVAYVLRRLRRFIEGEPVYIATSATIGNPREFIEGLVGREFEVVEAGSGKRGEVVHTFVKPLGRSRLMEVVSLARLCQEAGLKCLIFADSHRVVEMVKMVGEKYGVSIEVHRAGLRPEERAEIEERMRSGELLTVAATPTLELGIDVGDLDVVVLYSIPPTFTRYAQRTGRCGRRGQRAYVFVVLGDDPISSYYERHPEDFFSGSYDPLAVDRTNEEVARVHLIAMARDRPVAWGELTEFERRVAEGLVTEGYLSLRRGVLLPTRRGLRLLRERSSLRGIGEVVRIYTEGGSLLGVREMPMALRELHPGAVYFHRGRAYLSLKLTRRRAVVRRLPYGFSYVTVPIYSSTPEHVEVLEESEALGLRLSYLRLKLREAVYGYVVKTFPDWVTVREEVLSEPCEYEFETKGLLAVFPAVEGWSEYQCAEAFHAVEHALITAAQTIVGASHTDMGGVSFPTGHVYIYDTYPGGSGVSKLLLSRFKATVARAYRIVSECTCRDGCPRCIYSPYCGNNNRVLSRTRARAVLEGVLSGRLRAGYVERGGRAIV